MNEDPKHPGGRPTKYRSEYAKTAETLAKLGAKMEEIAEGLGVAPSTIYLWAKEHDEFSESIFAGRAATVERLRRSLYARAAGYSHKDVDIRVVAGELVQTPIIKRYAPDVRALEFALTNLAPDEFRRVQVVDNTSSDGSMSPKETNYDPELIRKIAKELDEEC